MKYLLSLLLLAFSTADSDAATMITLDGTVGSSTSSAYLPGQAFSITFVLADYTLTGNPTDYTDQAGEYDWGQDETPGAPIYSNVSFTGSGGSFVAPSGTAGEMYLYIGTLGSTTSTYFMFVAGVDEGAASQMGMTVGSDDVKSILAGVFAGGVFPGLAVPGTNPEDYLSTLYGSYPVTMDVGTIDLESGDNISFIPTTMTIAAVPEPSTYGGLGAAAVFIGFIRRRGR